MHTQTGQHICTLWTLGTACWSLGRSQSRNHHAGLYTVSCVCTMCTLVTDKPHRKQREPILWDWQNQQTFESTPGDQVPQQSLHRILNKVAIGTLYHTSLTIISSSPGWRGSATARRSVRGWPAAMWTGGAPRASGSAVSSGQVQVWTQEHYNVTLLLFCQSVGVWRHHHPELHTHPEHGLPVWIHWLFLLHIHLSGIYLLTYLLYFI